MSPQAADPSQPTLTATNGTNKITFADGHVLTLNVTATDGTWSFNGSRLAFVDSAGAIRTVRFNNQGDIGLCQGGWLAEVRSLLG
jgi:prepilin-type processing-associated H-X9-DG protein